MRVDIQGGERSIACVRRRVTACTPRCGGTVKRFPRSSFGAALVVLGVMVGVRAGLSAKTHVQVIKLEDVIISPVVASFIQRAIDKAADSGAECLIIELDTPGGLLASTKVITTAMMTAPVPVVVYVYPQGAGAVSAGTFITMASHFAAMAPGTNIGAAHPVSGGDQEMSETMKEKATNYAAANIRALAKERHRNADWAEKAVRESLSATNEEAVKLKVVEATCKNLDELLEVLHGRTVELPDGKRTLHTKDATVETIEFSKRDEFLIRLAHPNIAYVLMMIGTIGLITEVSHPGAIFPGVVGAICLVLGLYSLSMLPVNYAGVALILLGFALMIADLKIASHGLLTAGGAVALVLGSVMLIDTSVLDVRIHMGIILGLVGALVAFFAVALSLAIRAQMRKVATGQEGMVGLTGVARSRLAPTGTVFVHGERWNAFAPDEVIEPDEWVEVVDVSGMILTVRRIGATQPMTGDAIQPETETSAEQETPPQSTAETP